MSVAHGSHPYLGPARFFGPQIAGKTRAAAAHSLRMTDIHYVREPVLLGARHAAADTHRWLRWTAAAGAYGEAIAHIPVIEAHLTEAPYIGVGFVLLTIAGFGLAHLLLSADALEVWIACVLVSAAALAGYALSRGVGLPQLGDDVGDWAEPLGLVAVACEAVLLGCSIARLVALRADHRSPRSPRWDR